MRTTAISFAALLAALGLGACSPDVLTAAGTQAQAAAQAAKAGQQEKQMADERIRAMQDAMQQHDRQMGEQVDPAQDKPSR